MQALGLPKNVNQQLRLSTVPPPIAVYVATCGSAAWVLEPLQERSLFEEPTSWERLRVSIISESGGMHGMATPARSEKPIQPFTNRKLAGD